MNVYVSLVTGIVYVEFAVLMGFLVFFYFRTRSKGLILVTAGLALMQVNVLTWIAAAVCNVFNIGQWEPGIDVRGVKLFQRLDIAIVTTGIEAMLCYGLCLLGAFLIYKEWRQAKFRQPEPEPIEEPTS
jgi:hypothetical protein